MGSSPTSSQHTSTVTPACTNRSVRVYLVLIIVSYVSLTYAPLWIQSEAKGMNKAGYKTEHTRVPHKPSFNGMGQQTNSFSKTQ